MFARAHSPRGNGGFTLMEMLVALAVLGVAVSIFAALFSGSLDLSRKSSNQAIAANIAEERLAGIVSSPGYYKWLTPAGVEDTRFSIELTGEDPAAGNPVDAPAAMPAEPAAYRRQEAQFEAFRWEAFGKLVPGGAYYEVTVVVRYEERGRPQLVAVTSAVPAIAVPAAALHAPEDSA